MCVYFRRTGIESTGNYRRWSRETGIGFIPEYHSEPAYTRSSGRYAEDGASKEQGLLLLIVDGCSRVSAFGFVQSQNERGWMDVGQNIRSEKVMRYY